MSSYDWLLVLLIGLGGGVASVFLVSRRDQKRKLVRVTRVAELFADESDTFEGQLRAARQRYYNDIDVPYDNLPKAQNIVLAAMVKNWPQYTVYDIEDLILAEPYDPTDDFEELDGDTNGENFGDGDFAEAVERPAGPLSEPTGRRMWSTLQHWKRNPDELFALLPRGARAHYSRSPKIQEKFLDIIAAVSGKLSHAIYALTVQPDAKVETKTTLDEIVWFLAADVSGQPNSGEPDEPDEPDDFNYEQALSVAPTRDIAGMFDLTDEQLTDENYLSQLGHPNWYPANWREQQR